MQTAEFQAEFLSRATMPKPDDAAALIQGYVVTRHQTLTQATELGVGKEGTAEVSMKLASAFVRRWMMLRFAAIDLSFTRRPWWLVIERDGTEGARIVAARDQETDPAGDSVLRLVASVPRFWRTEAEAKGIAFGPGIHNLKVESVFAGTLDNGRRGSENYRRRDVHIHAKLPDGLGHKHVRLVREAMSHLFVAEALLYARGIDLGYEGDFTDRHNRRNPKVEVIWAPSRELLSVTTTAPRPVGDPAVLFTVCGHSFLLDFYDTPDEKPIEHLIREFSEGRLLK